MRFVVRIAAVIAAALAGTPASASWYEAKSKHFVIYADESPSSLETFANKLEKFDKAVRMVRSMDDPPIGDAGRVKIFVLRNTDAVSKLAVGKDSPIAGFYIPRVSGSVAFVPRRTDGNSKWDVNADTVFFHEYSHHLMLQNTDAVLPPWLVEGFAEFFSTAQFPKDGSVELGLQATHRAAGLFLLDKPKIEDLLGTGLKDGASGEDFERFYGRAWLLTHYLTFADSRRGQLAKYVSEIKRGIPLLTAAADAFGDLKELDRDLDRYVNGGRLKFVTVSSPDLANIAVSLRPLRAGEATIMPIRVRSARGVDNKTAPEVAALARGVAQSYPRDPDVQRELAEAEFDEHDYAAAEQAAGRALAADPKLAKALIYKGRAEMELAKSNPKADWQAIRQNFLAANKLDTEDPEALYEFYQSFLHEGVRPTANAMAALHYASDLAPQDLGLRMNSAIAYLEEGKLKEARSTLMPVAYSPHGGSLSTMAQRMMANIEKGDARAALESMNDKSTAATGSR